MNNETIGISAIEVVLPEKRMSIAEMACLVREDVTQLKNNLRLHQKPVLDHNQNILQLALQAARQLIEKNSVNVFDIDLIIHASCGIQDKQLWSPSAKIQKEIQANNAFAFDIQNGCNSGNLALEIASKLLAADNSKQIALIIVADALSGIVNYKNPLQKCIFSFSDAASAVLVRKNISNNKLLSFAISTNAIFADSLYKPVNNQHIWMNDDEEEDQLLIKEYEERYTNMIIRALKKADKNIHDVSQIIMNQGDHKLISKLAARLDFPVNQIFRSHENYGHLGGTDIFFGLKHVIENGLVKAGDFVVLASSAIGFSWGASVIKI